MTSMQRQFRDAVLSNDAAQAGRLLEQDKTLASCSLDPDDEDYPLYRATEQANYDLAQLLLQHGADVDKPARMARAEPSMRLS